MGINAPVETLIFWQLRKDHKIGEMIVAESVGQIEVQAWMEPNTVSCFIYMPRELPLAELLTSATSKQDRLSTRDGRLPSDGHIGFRSVFDHCELPVRPDNFDDNGFTLEVIRTRLDYTNGNVYTQGLKIEAHRLADHFSDINTQLANIAERASVGLVQVLEKNPLNTSHQGRMVNI